jgi:hypothetical protein
MREEFKPKKEELLRKAWKAEWDSMEDPRSLGKSLSTANKENYLFRKKWVDFFGKV